MKCRILSYLLCNCLIVTAGNSSREDDHCIRFEDNGVCACSYDSAGPVACYFNRSIFIQPCYCMYYDSIQNLSIVGHCYYSFYGISAKKEEITSSIEFNNDVCSWYGDLNRMGRFCGQCSETYGLAAYSYQLFSCIPCQNYGYKNWLRYFAVSLLPLTVFYIAAVLLSFNITSSSFNGIVLVLQCLLSPLVVTTIQGGKNFLSDYHSVLLEMKVGTSFFCTVNLDFFRLAYPPFCLHPDAKFFHIMSLDYLVALYPFLLIFMTYVLVTAYDKQYRLVVWMWRPVQRCVRWHRNTWNIRTSLIEIFATFILFSYVKILGVSVQILSFTATQDLAGNNLKNYYTLYDEYFGPEHLPFALLAIAISSVFVVLPILLLAVYPCRCLHKCLNYCGLRFQTLHVFMDAFQGSYRTEPHDLRYFSAFYLLLRMLLVMQFQFFTSMLMYLTSGILFISAAALVALFQPYKVKAHNTIDVVLMLLLGIFFVCYHARMLMSEERSYISVLFPIEYTCTTLLLFYFLSLLAWKLFGGKLQAMAQKVKVMWTSIVHHTIEHSRGEGLESFDREVNTGKASSHTPLLREQNPTYST